MKRKEFPESYIQRSLVTYLEIENRRRVQKGLEPIVYRFDPLANQSIHPRVAKRAKELGHREGLLDLEILHPTLYYHGLAIDFKRGDKSPFKLDGRLRSEYLGRRAEQVRTIVRLRRVRYYADFAVGLDEAINKVGDYIALIDKRYADPRTLLPVYEFDPDDLKKLGL